MGLPFSSESYPPLTLPVPPVPLPDSAANVNIADVVGNKTDTSAGTSLYALAHKLDNDAYNIVRAYPTLAGGAAVISAAADWTLGVYAQIVPAATIATAFHVRQVIVETCDKAGVFELELSYGAADTVFATLRYSVVGALASIALNLPVGGTLIPANSRVRARLASSDGLANQCTQAVSLLYTFDA